MPDRADSRDCEADLLPQPGPVQRAPSGDDWAERNRKVIHHEQLRQEIVQGEVRDERHQLLGKDQRQLHAGGDHVQA